MTSSGAEPAPTPMAEGDPEPRRLVVGIGRALVVFALWGLAVAQPVLDLFGQNPEFFVAARLGRAEVIAFALVVVFVVPLVIIAIGAGVAWLVPSVAPALYRAVVFVLVVAFATSLLVGLGLDGLLVTAALVLPAAGAVAWLEGRWAPGRLALQWLALGPLAFLAVFLWASPTADLLWADDARVEEGLVVGRPAPVVMAVFDEFPLASIVRPDGTVNERRFPNFARLAGAATWYPEAATVTSQTTAAVPSLMTGTMPFDSALPTSSAYPRNLFTLLGGSYDLQVTETVTNICPDSACGQDESGDGRGLSDAIADAAVAYGHIVLPPSERDRLPAIDEAWGGFVGGVPPPPAVDRVERGRYMGDLAREAAVGSPAGLGSTFASAVAAAEVGDRSLFFVHDAFVPHRPWRNTQTGARYGGTMGDLGTTDQAWPEDPAAARFGFQRHLLSVGYADFVLGQLIDRLQRQEQWEEALVVVTADHGVAFDPGSALRPANRDTLHEVFNIPLFVKGPGQVEGRVEERDALLIDVLPTIVDMLDIETSWAFDGRSLVGEPDRPDPPEFFPAGSDPRVGGFAAVLEAAERNHRDYLPYSEGWLGVAQVGELGARVGDDADSTDRAVDMAWRLNTPAAFVIDDAEEIGAGLPPQRPVVVSGTVTSSGPALPDELLVGVNGRVAGVATVTGEGDERTFRALVAEQFFRQGPNEITLLRVAGPAADASLLEIPRT